MIKINHIKINVTIMTLTIIILKERFHMQLHRALINDQCTYACTVHGLLTNLVVVTRLQL